MEISGALVSHFAFRAPCILLNLIAPVGPHLIPLANERNKEQKQGKDKANNKVKEREKENGKEHGIVTCNIMEKKRKGDRRECISTLYSLRKLRRPGTHTYAF